MSTGPVSPLVGRPATPARGASWQDAPTGLDGLPGGGLNIAYEAVDRHVVHGRGEHVALTFLDADGIHLELTYAALADRTARFAEVLRALGVAPGELVCGFSGRLPDLYVALLGTLKARSVFSPLFAAFGPDPVRQRMVAGRARVLVTTPALYRRKIEPIRASLPDLEHVLLIGPEADALVGAEPLGPGVRPLAEPWAATTGTFEIEPTDPEERALVHFTSGTTGAPKGAVHVHDAVVSHHLTARAVLDLHDTDVFWCTADPGWVTGTSYGVIAPLTCGVSCIVDELEFDARRWYSLLERHAVTVWYTAPTALRMLMKAGAAPLADRDLGALRHICSVGEPLNPEVVHWGVQALHREIHDTWWQTETGAIMIANLPGVPVHPGAMGVPVPGIEAAVIQRDPEGRPGPAAGAPRGRVASWRCGDRGRR
jgi:acetyl-CoA synthetase